MWTEVKVIMNIVIVISLCYLIDGKQNYCPGDDILNIPSHSDKSNWSGWHCRRHSMSYKGTLHNLESIDFKAIEEANKTILRMHLSNREISEEIPANIFQPLQSLKQLDLHLNATQLSPNMFDTLTNLEHLSIYTYQEYIPQNIFSHLFNLKYLKLYIRPKKSRLKPYQQQCEEYQIPSYDETFIENQIITSQLFKSLKQLEYLSISCQCQSIPHDMLRFQTQSLRVLILKTNLSYIPKKLFDGMYKLKTLQIKSSHKHLVLDQTLFSHLTSLETLYVIFLNVCICIYIYY